MTDTSHTFRPDPYAPNYCWVCERKDHEHTSSDEEHGKLVSADATHTRADAVFTCAGCHQPFEFCRCPKMDASSNRAAHYCLTPGGWVECSEEMCQRHSACVEKRNAIPNRVCPNCGSADAVVPLDDPENPSPWWCSDCRAHFGHDTRNSVADTKAALEKYRAHCIGESNRLLGNANWCERLLRQMEDDGA